MIEAIVQFDVQNCLDPDRYFVFKPEFTINGNNAGEYDVAVYDKTNNYYYGFEVKHTDIPYSNQYKNLENEELRNVMDYQYGNRKNVSVLYRGSSFKTPEAIYYINISDFLKTVDQYRDMDKAMDLLTKDLPVRDPIKEEQIIAQKKTSDISNTGFKNALNFDNMDAYQIAETLNIKPKCQHIDDVENHNVHDAEQEKENPTDPGSSGDRDR